jgi:hypothetical protein
VAGVGISTIPVTGTGDAVRMINRVAPAPNSMPTVRLILTMAARRMANTTVHGDTVQLALGLSFCCKPRAVFAGFRCLLRA